MYGIKLCASAPLVPTQTLIGTGMRFQKTHGKGHAQPQVRVPNANNGNEIRDVLGYIYIAMGMKWGCLRIKII